MAGRRECDLRKQQDMDRSAQPEPQHHCDGSGEILIRDGMQADAIETSVTRLQEHAQANGSGRARGRIVLPCGTGKARTTDRQTTHGTGTGLGGPLPFDRARIAPPGRIPGPSRSRYERPGGLFRRRRCEGQALGPTGRHARRQRIPAIASFRPGDRGKSVWLGSARARSGMRRVEALRQAGDRHRAQGRHGTGRTG